MLFADSAATLERVRASGAVVARTVVFDSPGDDGMAAFETSGAAARAGRPEIPATYEAALHPDDLAVLIYTSGTTGDPKGVMLSHDNVGFDARAALKCGLDGLVEGNPVLSVLPYSHIFEHTIAYIYLLARVRYFICHDAAQVLDDMRDVRPSVMTSVPRIFDRVLAGVSGKAMKAGGLQGKLVPWALAVGRAYARSKTFGRLSPAPRVALRSSRAGSCCAKCAPRSVSTAWNSSSAAAPRCTSTRR